MVSARKKKSKFFVDSSPISSRSKAAGDAEIKLWSLGNLNIQILKGVVSVEDVDLVNGVEMTDQMMLNQMKKKLCRVLNGLKSMPIIK